MLRITEIFGPTIQGEGAVIGAPTVFVRAGGCDYRCSWCDSLHAVDTEHRHTWAKMDSADVFAEVERLSGGTPLTVSLSGGNPAIQDFSDVIALGKSKGYDFALETQGSIAREWFSELAPLILSPKPPSSGHVVDWDKFDACVKAAGEAETVLKIVIFDDTDYAWAKDAAARYPQLPLYIQPGNHTPPSADEDDAAVDMDGIMDRYEWLIDKTLADKWYSPKILPQLHVLIWGNKRGV
ncbi:7-carboxy-7-deazaguanine synthase QueE [Cognatishimia activa]|uniref:7-carboxy-7-deazaguanine synthase n=1 Tax=Cognatishimia activa TaxID=1715691 RepID=A0A0P1IYS3_9RHOB|nr:7-carboxy-7-deazaguanine synthase QueE [Cognatishimia activa]CUI61515.1 7-carboxy-7-deazaguanine synthase [Cognatishimia activa]CUK26301.1 7-carboxy-7-deazaguanine synthase [Cognatishimia activa]